MALDKKRDAHMADRIEFTLDGKAVEAEPGETIWQVANRLGTEIPHLCYAPEPGYRPDGNCRACMVEIEGERVLAASCIRAPSPGMTVTSISSRVRSFSASKLSSSSSRVAICSGDLLAAFQPWPISATRRSAGRLSPPKTRGGCGF